MTAGRLLELTVTDLALIDRLRLTLAPGLNVITGETGAGKSLLIDALGLVRGARADLGLIRHGAEAARVEALFDRLPEPLIAAREIATGGRSTARLDDQATTASRSRSSRLARSRRADARRPGSTIRLRPPRGSRTRSGR